MSFSDSWICLDVVTVLTPSVVNLPVFKVARTTTAAAYFANAVVVSHRGQR